MMRQFLSLLCVALAGGFAPPVQPPSRTFTSSLQAINSCDVAVFGGGFGGLYTALAISRESARKGCKLDVALVEPTETFVFLPLLYDLTVGTATEAEVCPTYNDLLQGTGVRHVRASLESLRSTKANLEPKTNRTPDTLEFRAGVVAVGASPESMLASVPGAFEYAQPFYTAQDAKQTRRLLNKLEGQGKSPRIAVVGGGFGGVELSASVKRRLPKASVTLLSRGAPMAGTRAEPLVDKALKKLGVVVEECSVQAIEPYDSDNDKKVLVRRKRMSSTDELVNDDTPWDCLLWTAGSGPASPVPAGCHGLKVSETGRLATDSTLRCIAGENDADVRREGAPRLWALGDCAEVVLTDKSQPAIPKTAQAAMQQAETVANNVLAQLEVEGKIAPAENFVFQDLGNLLTLGGPNGAVLAPREGSFAPIFAPLLDTAGSALGVADEVLSLVGRSPVVEKLGLSPETLGLSLGSHGLGVDNGAAPGTLAGTLTGAARRAVYAVRMPTNQQRAVSFVSAAISTAAALAKEASERREA